MGSKFFFESLTTISSNFVLITHWQKNANTNRRAPTFLQTALLTLFLITIDILMEVKKSKNFVLVSLAQIEVLLPLLDMILGAR